MHEHENLGSCRSDRVLYYTNLENANHNIQHSIRNSDHIGYDTEITGSWSTIAVFR